MSSSSRLKSLLIAAGEAPPDRRIEYRDEIARFGNDAIVELIPWLRDRQYAAFAIRTIQRAGELGAAAGALAALRSARSLEIDATIQKDLDAAIDAIKGESRTVARRQPRATTESQPPRGTLHPNDLVIGRVYKRRKDLHLAGLGGNWQKGISYPRDGDYALLFSDPSKVHETGYRDAPVGRDGYRYFGEWNGTGDMSMTGGNLAIRDRSANLHLFVAAFQGMRYEGHFVLDRAESEETVRDGRQFRAIVFILRRA